MYLKLCNRIILCNRIDVFCMYVIKFEVFCLNGMSVWFVIIGTFETVKMLQVLSVLSVAEILLSVISGSIARNRVLQTFPELLIGFCKRSPNF